MPPIVLAVGSYRTRASARQDFAAALAAGKGRGDNGRVAGAVVEKGAGGQLEMDRYDDTAFQGAWGPALLGGAITVVAVPLGITFLASALPTNADWAGACAIVGWLWHNLPRDELRNMSNLLESRQAGLVLVAVDRCDSDVGSLLSNATAKIVTECVHADLTAGYGRAIGTSRRRVTRGIIHNG